MSASYPEVSLDCYVRASAVGITVDEFLKTISTYREKELISDFAVERWPAEIRLTDETAESPHRAQYQQFQRWADSKGVSLEPAFRRRERTTQVSDTPDTFLVFPVLCLAVHINGELVSVAPHTSRMGSYSVTDALEDVGSFASDRVTDVEKFPPDHPVRSVLATNSIKDSVTDFPDDKSTDRTSSKLP